MDVLVSGAWLEEHLGDPDLRVLECTVHLALDPATGRYGMTSGRASWEAGHIPTSAFVDLVDELSDPHPTLRFAWPSPERVAGVMARLGVGAGTRVVLYDRAMTMWATRVWWVLAAHGFTDVAVLDGGFAAWTADGRPVTTDPAPSRPAASFSAALRPGWVADRAEVLASIGTEATCIVNSLSEAQHRGEDLLYGRPGHIPSAVNIPAAGLVDRTTHRYLDVDTLRARFADALGRDRVITYCGGGIAATSDAFVLTALLGHPGVGVYDGSMSEWVLDPDAPLEV
jgi:thiosulfate/3-mercaptopyruvate sulfurtransferase